MRTPAAGEAKSDTISLADEEAVKQLLVGTVFILWDIVDSLSRLRPTKHERYRGRKGLLVGSC